MGFFGSSRPRVSKDEFRKVRNDLSAIADLSHRELDQLELMLDSALFEKREEDQGIDETEIEQFITRLRDLKFRDAHTFSDKQIDSIETVLKKYL